MYAQTNFDWFTRTPLGGLLAGWLNNWFGPNTWQKLGQNSVAGLSLQNALDNAQPATNGILPPNAYIAGIGCFPRSLQQTVNDLFPGRWLPGAGNFTPADDVKTYAVQDVPIAFSQFKAAITQAKKWRAAKCCTQVTIRLYVDAKFLRAVKAYVKAQGSTTELRNFQKACAAGICLVGK